MSGNGYGRALGFSNHIIVVGTPFDDDNGLSSGAADVYQYVNGAWVENAKLAPNNNMAGGQFGFSVAVSGNTVIIGASEDSDDGMHSGSAYIYVLSGGQWVQQAKLVASDTSNTDLFGTSVSIDGDTVIVGAP